jgi:hypothetical protein
MRRIMTVFVTAALLLSLSACTIVVPNNTTTGSGSSGGGQNPGGQTNPGTQKPRWGVQTKTSSCQVNGPRQDLACTPGDVLNVTKDDICQSGYARSVRNVPTSVKDKVYAEYGITSRSTGEYEVDHLVSLELGGSNDISNLWPEAASPKPGFHEKDKVENYLHDQVCSSAVSLQDAQAQIATDWLVIYNQMPSK